MPTMPDQLAATESRFSSVASFYGPGNVISWLCTVGSVFVTWCLHTEYKYTDTITTDLIFVLAVPGVAAGHGMSILFFQSPGERQHTIEELFTASDPDLIQRAAAAEAALNVCETFSMIAVAMVFVSMSHGHLKRTLAVLAVGIFAFSTEMVVFIQTGGRFGVGASNLSRPFLFNLFGVMVCMLGFLVLWACLFVVLMAWLRWARTREQARVAAGDARLGGNLHATRRSSSSPERALAATADLERLAHVTRAFSATHANETQRRKSRREETRVTARFTFLFSFLSPLSFFLSTLGASGFFGLTDFMSSASWAVRLSFFIPKSAVSITELDQMFSLGIGVVALLYSLWHAFKSQRT